MLIVSFGVPSPGIARADTRAPVILTNLNGNYPTGVPDSAEPSGEAPPTATALSGYQMTYQNDFTDPGIPSGWNVFTGIPGGDPGGHFEASDVAVSGGMLDLNTARDPQLDNRWGTGGICQCGVARVYGAYFVRSRITGAGPTQVELLWPKANLWPPEIDFNETGGSVTSTGSSVHVTQSILVIRRSVHVDMTQWHTWGVIWTPSYILYTVDGRIWGEVKGASYIPKIAMTLDMESRQECEENRQCPTAPELMEIDWVAEYAPTAPLS
jgi:hypothetical protein